MSLTASAIANCRCVFVLAAGLLAAACSSDHNHYILPGQERLREYDVRLAINGKYIPQKIILSERGAVRSYGRVIYPGVSADGTTYYLYQTDRGVYTTRDPQQDGVLLLPAVPEPGRRWQSPTRIHILDNRHETFAGGDTFISVHDSIVFEHVIRRLDAVVSVPAGRFASCLEIQSTARVPVEARTSGIEAIVIEQSEWYAPGTGLIKRIRIESTVPSRIEGTLVQELTAVVQ